MKRILVGTSGWSYDEWVGPFYPKTVAKERWLPFYGERFPTVEVNASHYHLPSQAQTEAMAERLAGTGLTDVVYKAPREITHELLIEHEVAGATERSVAFFENLEPMAEADRLAGLLYQFSHSAGPEVVLPGIEAVLDEGPPAPVIVEVRHAAFNEDRHLADLRDLVEGQGGCVAATDSPASTITRAPPAEMAYFRFHGRNERTWFMKDPPGVHGSARYDYLYPEEELAKLAERIEAAQADTVYVFFNNHAGGKAPINGQELMELMEIPAPRERKTLDDFA